jgi:3-hydroxyacyl-[acyl-carrier-protein] dehydratase
VHFAGNPNMPGALQLEAMAQMLTIAITTLPGLEGKTTHALSHKVRFRKEVVPGDRLEIDTKLISWSRGVAKGVGFGKTNGEIACEAEMMITIPEILESFLPKVR